MKLRVIAAMRKTPGNEVFHRWKGNRSKKFAECDQALKPRSHSANLLARVVAAITRCMGIAAMSVVTLKIHSRYLLERNLNLLAINMLRFGLEDLKILLNLVFSKMAQEIINLGSASNNLIQKLGGKMQMSHHAKEIILLIFIMGASKFVSKTIKLIII